MKPNTQYRKAFKSKFQDDFDVMASDGMLYTSIKVMILVMGSGAMTWMPFFGIINHYDITLI